MKPTSDQFWILFVAFLKALGKVKTAFTVQDPLSGRTDEILILRNNGVIKMFALVKEGIKSFSSEGPSTLYTFSETQKLIDEVLAVFN